MHAGNWIRTIRPLLKTNGIREELILILEDDIDVSPYIYRFLSISTWYLRHLN